MANTDRVQICYSDIVQGNTACVNPTVRWEAVEGLIFNCDIGANCTCVDAQILPGATKACFNLIIDCEDCEKCPTQVITKCLCDLGGATCGPCEVCNNGICTSVCADGQKCDEANDVCVDDCVSSADCEDGKICVGGRCECPPTKPYIDPVSGRCRACEDNSHCPPCTRCVNGECIPLDCNGGACDPVQDKCVECVDDAQCQAKDPNSCCTGNDCGCCTGFKLDPTTGMCVPDDECKSADDCPECQRCVGGECVAMECPDGYICRGDECISLCDCNNPTCPRGESCTPWGNSMCVCLPCEGACDDNSDCTGLGCYCNKDTGMCTPSPCASVTCSTSTDCGEGCGCMNGECLPCDSFDCSSAVNAAGCAGALGCECNGTDCVPSNCGNPCVNYADCADGCTCDGGICKSCSDYSCVNDDCTQTVGCQCVGGACVDGDCPANEYYMCAPATYTDHNRCAKVSIIVDGSKGLTHPNNLYQNDIADSINAFNSRLINSGNAEVGMVTFPLDMNTPIPLSNNPDTLSFVPGGYSNITEAFDMAAGQLGVNTTTGCAPVDGCQRTLVLFTAGAQNETATPAGGTFESTGVTQGDGTTSDENDKMVEMANAARACGIEVIVVTYGDTPLGADNCEVWDAVAHDTPGGDNNIIMVPNATDGNSGANGNAAGAAMDEVYNRVRKDKGASSECVLAPAGTDPSLLYCGSDCNCGDRDDKDAKAYMCTPEGCMYAPGVGTLTAAECCDECEYTGGWKCDNDGSGECYPSDTSTQSEIECNEKCKCGDLTIVGVTFDCDQGVKMNVESTQFNSNQLFVTLVNLADPTDIFESRLDLLNDSTNDNLADDATYSLSVRANEVDLCSPTAGPTVTIDRAGCCAEADASLVTNAAEFNTTVNELGDLTIAIAVVNNPGNTVTVNGASYTTNLGTTGLIADFTPSIATNSMRTNVYTHSTNIGALAPGVTSLTLNMTVNVGGCPKDISTMISIDKIVGLTIPPVFLCNGQTGFTFAWMVENLPTGVSYSYTVSTDASPNVASGNGVFSPYREVILNDNVPVGGSIQVDIRMSNGIDLLGNTTTVQMDMTGACSETFNVVQKGSCEGDEFYVSITPGTGVTPGTYTVSIPELTYAAPVSFTSAASTHDVLIPTPTNGDPFTVTIFSATNVQVYQGALILSVTPAADAACLSCPMTFITQHTNPTQGSTVPSEFQIFSTGFDIQSVNWAVLSTGGGPAVVGTVDPTDDTKFSVVFTGATDGQTYEVQATVTLNNGGVCPAIISNVTIADCAACTGTYNITASSPQLAVIAPNSVILQEYAPVTFTAVQGTGTCPIMDASLAIYGRINSTDPWTQIRAIAGGNSVTLTEDDLVRYPLFGFLKVDASISSTNGCPIPDVEAQWLINQTPALPDVCEDYAMAFSPTSYSASAGDNVIVNYALTAPNCPFTDVEFTLAGQSTPFLTSAGLEPGTGTITILGSDLVVGTNEISWTSICSSAGSTCTDSGSITIEVSTAELNCDLSNTPSVGIIVPQTTFEPNTNYVFGASVSVVQALTYMWTASGGASVVGNTSNSPTIAFPAPGFYTVTCVVTGINGCIGSQQVAIEVVTVCESGPLVAIPSVASPTCGQFFTVTHVGGLINPRVTEISYNTPNRGLQSWQVNQPFEYLGPGTIWIVQSGLEGDGCSAEVSLPLVGTPTCP